MTHEPRRPTAGVRKAAILLIQLGRDQAAPMLSHLPEAEVEEISAEIARLDDVDGAESDAVLAEFAGWRPPARNIAQGGARASPASCSSSRSAPSGPARSWTGCRRPRSRCRSSSCTAPTRASCSRSSPTSTRSDRPGARPHAARQGRRWCSSGLPPELQAEVAHRIAVMDRTSPEIIRAVEASLERKLSIVLQPAELSRGRRRRPAGRHHQPLRPRHRAADPRGPRGPRRRARRRGPQPDVHVRGHRPPRRPRRAAGAAPGRRPPTSPSRSRASATTVRDKITRQPVRAGRARTCSRRSTCSARSG